MKKIILSLVILSIFLIGCKEVTESNKVKNNKIEKTVDEIIMCKNVFMECENVCINEAEKERNSFESFEFRQCLESCKNNFGVCQGIN